MEPLAFPDTRQTQRELEHRRRVFEQVMGQEDRDPRLTRADSLQRLQTLFGPSAVSAEVTVSDIPDTIAELTTPEANSTPSATQQ